MRDLIEIGVIGLVLLVVVAALMVPIYWLETRSCASKWEESGMKSDYAFFAGCRIEKNGKWIPADAYRELDK